MDEHLLKPYTLYVFKHMCIYTWASLVAQSVKNLPAVQETQVRSLGQEDPLEKAMATHSSILAWRIPGTEEPGGLWSMLLLLLLSHFSCGQLLVTLWTIAHQAPLSLGFSRQQYCRGSP